MINYTINNDITVFFLTANSFPDGILAAYKKLESLLPDAKNRKYFGISRPDKNGVIIYKAAVEESYTGEAEKYGCERFVIKKGEYLAETIINWRNDINSISKTFKKLLSDPRLDKNGFCLEIYLNDTDVMCLVPIQTKEKE